MKLIMSNPIFRVGFMLAVFAIVATSLVALTEKATRNTIIDNEKKTLLAAINALVDSSAYDNDIVNDVLVLDSNARLNTTEKSVVYRARKNGKAVAAVFTSIAPNGYSGKIKLLVGVNVDGTLAGVRVISHKETPGLGDKIDVKKTDWILQFKGLSLTRPEGSKWEVKKDGGQFDQFTGATITPRAVVQAIKNALYFFDNNQDELFKVEQS
jgi:electron transport complex protein RnfG